MSSAADPKQLQATIDQAWDKRDTINTATTGPVRQAVETALAALDAGEMRVAEKKDGIWVVNQWLKKAVLLSFRLTDMAPIEGAPGNASWFDKVPSKFAGWGENHFRAAGFRAVPGSVVRHSAYIAPNVVLMPSFVNLGAHVGAGTMVDTWATVGSCAQIGRDCHLAGGVGIGGVLEPPNAQPVIIEDGVFVGSRVVIVEGVHVEKEAVIGAGVVLTQSTLLIDVTGSAPVELKGRVPARSIVIPGVRPKRFPAGEFGVPCALIIGRRTEATDRKVSLNQALRDFAVPV